jgi:hypothetical protein
MSNLSSDLGDRLNTRSNDFHGIIVREEINRSLIAASTAKTPEEQSSAMGGIVFSVAADRAYADRDNSSANSLMHQAKVATDFALGIVPVVSSVNDALQILNGMITGRDYTGNEMKTADYALRSLGIVLGLLPVKGVWIAGRSIGTSFFRGCEFLRSNGLRTLFIDSLRGLKQSSITAAEAIGELFARNNPNFETLIELNNDANRTLHLFAGSRQTLGQRGIKEFWVFLRDSGDTYTQEERLQFINTFRTGIKYEELAAPRMSYRWEAEGASRPERLRFLGTENITDPALARQRYAIPPANPMSSLNRYEIQPGTGIFTGETRANFGQPGGAGQIFVTGDRALLPKRVLPRGTVGHLP